jgi:hypothetical protein
MSTRVPNGWGDPSTERHLQVPPRYATGSRAAKSYPLWRIEVDFHALDQRDADGVFERVLDLLGVRHQGGMLTIQQEETDA